MTTRKTQRRRRTKADREFISEAEEILEVMRAGVADLSDRIEASEDADPDLVNSLFRAAHSLKALAGMFRFDPIEGLAHRLEDILDGLRLGRVPLSAPVLALIEETVALFAMLLERVGDAEAIEETSESIESLTTRIRAAMSADPEPVEDELARLDIDASLLRALTEYEEHRLRENIRRGRHIVLVSAPFDIQSFEEGLSELTASVRDGGEVLSTLPAAGDAPESQILFSLLVASERSAAEICEGIDFPTAEVHSVLAGPEGPIDAGARAPSEPRADSQDPAGTDEGAEPAIPVVPELESLQSISDTVRVDIRKLDELMNLVGELVIRRGAIGELVSRLSESPGTARLGDDLGKLHKGLDRKLRELQSAVLDVRMVPLRQVFERVSRVVRRMRRELGKDVDLEIRGADTELDKLIIEALIDPLMHVVRNALDHAIESTEERVASGKDPSGRISIEAFQRGSHVVISVTDDGRGIDAAALRRRAEGTGLIAPGATLAEREILDLMFEPGLSTRDEVTETSGRGVGMDVVRANLSALGGAVDVESTTGRGTRISMTVPITLAIIQSLIVGAGGQRFAIPLNAVLETLVIDEDAVQVSDGRELLNLRGEPLLLRRLANEFQLEGGAQAERPYVVVMGIGDQRLGLVVDRLVGQQDTVIKPIQGPIQTVRGISGATDLGDQDPVLVLDVSALVEDSTRRREAA